MERLLHFGGIGTVQQARRRGSARGVSQDARKRHLQIKSERDAALEAKTDKVDPAIQQLVAGLSRLLETNSSSPRTIVDESPMNHVVFLGKEPSAQVMKRLRNDLFICFEEYDVPKDLGCRIRTFIKFLEPTDRHATGRTNR